MNPLLQLREAFHFCLLEWLFRISESSFYTLKGGVNLRFFFRSPRYSEDLDLDVRGGQVATLKKNGFKILRDPAFLRMLRPYGIEALTVQSPEKSKQTATTQRFRVRLVSAAGVELPTKIECSRRPTSDVPVTERIPPEVAHRYGRLGFYCPHYPGHVVALQKIRALAGRVATQARDVFDLYLLIIGGHTQALRNSASLPPPVRQRAKESLRSLHFDDYAGHVIEFLEPEARTTFGTRQSWDAMRTTVMELLDHGP